MAASVVPAEMWREMFKQMAQRNEVITVAPAGASTSNPAPDAEPKGAPVRLLEYSESRLVIQQPVLPLTGRGLLAGDRVQLTACWRGSRLIAETRVEGVIEVQLQEGVKMPAAVLAVPAECQGAQRRSFFRLDVHGLGFESVMLIPTRNGVPMPDALPVPCVMLNISAGGLGLVAATTDALLAHREYECRFKMPGGGQQVQFAGMIVNTTQRAGNTSFVGVRFLTGDQAAGSRQADQLNKIIVELQRRKRQMENLRPSNRG